MAIPLRVLNKGYEGYFVVEVLSQELWREDPLEVARRCHAGSTAMFVKWAPSGVNHRPAYPTTLPADSATR